MKCPYCDKQATPPLCEYCKAAIPMPEKPKSDARKKGADTKNDKKKEEK